MVLKLLFYDKTKNNEKWWNRLWDRFNKVKDRQWVISGGTKYGSKEVEFTFTNPDGTPICDQKSISEVVWVFVIEQINVEKFVVNGNDVTNQLKAR